MEEILFGRKVCSRRYRKARTLLIGEVSNLVRVVFAFTISRPEISVVLVELDAENYDYTDGFFPSFVRKQ